MLSQFLLFCTQEDEQIRFLPGRHMILPFSFDTLCIFGYFPYRSQLKKKQQLAEISFFELLTVLRNDLSCMRCN